MKRIRNLTLAVVIAVTTLLPVTQAEASYCPPFAGHKTTHLSDNGCKFGPTDKLVRGKVPSGWRAIYWDGQSVRHARPGKIIKTSEATFYKVS